MITLEELKEGVAYTKGKNTYKQTEDYINPFLDKVSEYTSTIRVQASAAPYNPIQQKEEINMYSKVYLQAELPSQYNVDDHPKVLGFLYSLDAKVPIVKIYKGFVNSACLNQTVFNPDYLIKQTLDSDIPDFKQWVEDDEKEFSDTIKYLQDTPIAFGDHTDFMGKAVDLAMSTKSKFNGAQYSIDPSIFVKGFKRMYKDKDSPYQVHDKNSDLFMYYNACTQSITDSKSFMNNYEQTCMVFDIVKETSKYINS